MIVHTSEKRREEIYHLIVSKGSIRVQELADLLQVTSETIRKDLFKLEQQGLIIKHHGRAEIKNDYYQLPVYVKAEEHPYEKEIIAQTAIQYIKDNTMIYLDPSSTCLKLTKYLPLRKGLTVVTNSLAIAQAVTQTNHDLILIGGKLLKKSNATIGVFANTIIDALNIDVAFSSTDGFLHVHGPSTFSLDEMEIKQHIIASSHQNILICDSSKFKKAANYVFAKYQDYDLLITERITDEEREMVKGIKQILVADLPGHP